MLLSATHRTPVMAPLEAAFALFKTFCITCRATTLNFGGDFRRDQSQSSAARALMSAFRVGRPDSGRSAIGPEAAAHGAAAARRRGNSASVRS